MDNETVSSEANSPEQIVDSAAQDDTTQTDATQNDAAQNDAVQGDTIEQQRMKENILEALKVVRDPEIPVNVVDLGLIYDVKLVGDGEVAIDMTLTSMGCPVQDMIQADAELAAMKVEGVKKASVEFVWSPPWSPQKMSEDGKKQMRMFGFNL